MESMEHRQTTPVIDQMNVRGQYEEIPTNTGQLAEWLSDPRDLSRLIADFDKDLTPLRDVGGMVGTQREAILKAYRDGSVADLASTHPWIFSKPVENLHKRVVSGDRDQPVGHNFFVNATLFLDAKLPWAKDFDELLRARTGASLYAIALSNDKSGKDRLLAAITENPDAEILKVLAVYLAGRSQEGEKFLNQKYGEILNRAKGRVYETTRELALTTGLRVDMLERAARQLHRAAFGSFDHLQGLVTSDNSGATGDYRIGSLRIEVHFDGHVRSPRLREGADAYHIITHELHHAASAQTRKEGYRCGLQIRGQGLEANEGMTEYLAQLSIGSPGIVRSTDGSLSVRRDVPYRAPVLAILALHEQYKIGDNGHFATLFNAYHGDVRSQAQLEQALDVFYQHDTAVSRYLNR